MKPAGGASPRYAAGIVPEGDLRQFLREELAKIQSSLNTIEDGFIGVTTVAPAKPRDGDLRRADGTHWNPGSGAGVYCYYSSTWHFLG